MASEGHSKLPASHQEEEYDDDDLGGTGNAEDDTEETFAEDGEGGTATDRAFDLAVGALEEMLLDPAFTSFQSSFLSRHCGEFEAGDENKLSYTPIFERYVESMESFIRAYLTAKVPRFDMEAFLGECEARGEEQLCGDAFDVLTSMSDFATFKELMLAHKEQTNWQQQQQQSQQPGASSSGTAAAASSSSSAPSQP